MKVWQIEAVTGYKPQTTFYIDFSIADNFGAGAIRDTYYKAFKHWKDDVVFLAELVLVLNWKIWEHFETNKTYAQIYEDLYFETHGWAQDNLHGKERDYYYNTID